MNEHKICEIFLDYLKKTDSQNAILLNGEWGTGKTFFFNSVMKPIADENDFSVIYISLNGVEKLEEIYRQLFIKMIPAIQNDGSGLKKKIAVLTNMLGNSFSNRLFKVNFDELIKELDFDLYGKNKYLICFDDLERCLIPIKRTLGFINNYTEHKKLKVVILSDESKISDNSIEYRDVKEKLVGRVLNFKIDIDTKIYELIKKYSYENDFYAWLNQNLDTIAKLFSRLKHNNLRTISFYLEVLHKLFPHIKDEEKEITEECIFFSAIICIEFKKGKLLSTHYNNYLGIPEFTENTYQRISESRILDSMKKDSDKLIEKSTKTYAELFYEEYLSYRINNYYFYPSIFEYILGGYLDVFKLGIELQNRKPQETSIYLLSYQNIISWNFRVLENDDFRNYLSKIIEGCKNGVFNIYQYIDIADYLYYFSINNIIEIEFENIENLILTGLELSKDEQELNENAFQHLISSKKYMDSNLKKIKERITSIHLEILNRRNFNRGNQLIEAIKSRSKDKLQKMLDGNTFSKDLLLFIDVNEMSDVISESSNLIIESFKYFLSKRYETINAGEMYNQDIPFLKELKNKLERKAYQIHEQPQKYNVNSLISSIDAFILKLSEMTIQYK